uniref:Uncharacterized protein n=1 Tax=Babesia bovis TaxID=5865 RepID=S6BA80_BABBO|nr:hypothetical protein [Babesia bovis]
MSHWYFGNNVNSIKLSYNDPMGNGILGSTNSHLEEDPTESLLHIGYDLTYSNALGKYVATRNDVHHVAFCNYYDVAFNTLYNIGRHQDISPEDFITFKNVRLITGNVFNIHLLLTEPLFKCAIISITNQNADQLLNFKVLNSIAKVIAPGGSIVFLTREKEAFQRLKTLLGRHSISLLLTVSDEQNKNQMRTVMNALAWKGSPISSIRENNTREYIETFFSHENKSLTGNFRMIVCDKYISNKPNQRLRKPVDTI